MSVATAGAGARDPRAAAQRAHDRTVPVRTHTRLSPWPERSSVSPTSYAARVHRDRHGRGIRGPLVRAGVPIAAVAGGPLRPDRERGGRARRAPLAGAAGERRVRGRPGAGGRRRRERTRRPRVRSSRPASCSPRSCPARPAGVPTSCSTASRSSCARTRVEDLEDLVHDIVVQVVANYLGLEPEVVDPGFGGAEPPSQA